MSEAWATRFQTIDDRLIVSSAGVKWESKHQVDKALLAYLTDASQMLEGQRHISIGFDKSRICGLQVANGAVVLPTNDAFWLPPQVRSVTRGGRLTDRLCRVSRNGQSHFQLVGECFFECSG